MLTFQIPRQVKTKIYLMSEIKGDSIEAQKQESIKQNTKKDISNI